MSKLQDNNTETDNPFAAVGNLPKKTLVIIGVVLAVVAVIWFVIYNFVSGIHNQGVKLQNDLMTQYANTQITLGGCLDKSRQAAGVASALTEAQVKILENAVTGRYVDDKGNSTAASGAAGKGAYFSAIHEAYPDLSEVSKTYQNVMIIVTGCRDEYNGKQQQLQLVINNFTTWQQQHTVFNAWGKSRFPNNNLTAAAPGYDEDSDITGKDALKRMRRVIVTGEAGAAYRNGKLPDQNLFGQNDK